MTPLVNGKVHRFETRGLYDGVSVLWDHETGTIWHHLTGEALQGPLMGKALTPVRALEHTTVEAALATDPETRVAVSGRPILRETRWAPGLEKPPELSPLFRGTMAPEDTRRPTLEVGIGVWRNEGTARYYPMKVVREAGGFVLDTLGGRRILVYYDPATRALTALETNARSARWDEKELVLPNGERVARGVRYGASGKQLETRRPLQVFTRWYGWALSFPKTSIYESR